LKSPYFFFWDAAVKKEGVSYPIFYRNCGINLWNTNKLLYGFGGSTLVFAIGEQEFPRIPALHPVIKPPFRAKSASSVIARCLRYFHTQLRLSA
jgi:hypothetical protein